MSSERCPASDATPVLMDRDATERGALSQPRQTVPPSYLEGRTRPMTQLFPALRESISRETAEASSRTFHQGCPRKPTLCGTCALRKPQTGREAGRGGDAGGNEGRVRTRSPVPASPSSSPCRRGGTDQRTETEGPGPGHAGIHVLQQSPGGWACRRGPSDKPQQPIHFGVGLSSSKKQLSF